jgi:hypothetical protein
MYDPNRYSNRRLKAQLSQTQYLQSLSTPLLGNSPSPPHSLSQSTPSLQSNSNYSSQSSGPEPNSINSWMKKLLPSFSADSLTWKPVPSAGWEKFRNPEYPKIYPINKVGYQDQISGPPPTKAQSFAEQVEKSRTDCKTCQVAQPDLVPLGCAIATADGEDLAVNGRQLVDHYRPYPGYNTPPIGQNPVMVTEPNRFKNAGDNRGLTPLFDHYDANKWKTPYDRTENLISTGIMVNPWTGTAFETFEKQLPPPTTSKYAMDKDQLKRTNPQLVWLNGGIDPNAPPPSKREVMEDIPGPDGGPNVWGTQLYSEQIGSRLKPIVEAQVWNNRNGIFSTEPSMGKEAPAGYVGLQPVLRSIPYLPPTQRTTLDIKGWVGPVNDTFNLGNNPVEQNGIVETRKVDLNDGGSVRYGPAAGFGGQEAESIVPVIDPKATWRGTTSDWMSGAFLANAQYDGGHVVTDPTVRDTLKGLSEETLPIVQSNTDVSGGHVLLDPTVRATLKGLNENQFPLVSASPLASLPSSLMGVIDPTVRDTLKGLNENQFPLVSATPLETQPSVLMGVIDPTVRDTLKGLSEENLPTSSLYSIDSSYVLIDPTVRDTLKGLSEQNLATAPASEQDRGSWISFQGPLRIGAKREQYTTNNPQVSAHYSSSPSGPNVGPALTTTRQNRGRDELFWTEPSGIVAGTGDTMTRWIGLQTHDTKTEMGPAIPVANFTQENGVNMTMVRPFPIVFPNCQRPDDLDDEFLSIRPTYFGESSVT